MNTTFSTTRPTTTTTTTKIVNIVRVTATGCADYKPDGSNAWVRYSLDRQTAEVGCHGATHSQTWQLVCRAGDWTGYVDNCAPLGIHLSSCATNTVTNSSCLPAVNNLLAAVCLRINGKFCSYLTEFLLFLSLLNQWMSHVTESSESSATSQQESGVLTLSSGLRRFLRYVCYWLN